MTEVETEIAESIRAANTRLRFDKVVQRLSKHLKAALMSLVPDGQSVIVTISAPISRPAETAAVLERHFSDRRPDREIQISIHGNHVRVLPVSRVPADMPKVVVLVHNPESDPRSILAIAKSRLLERNRSGFHTSAKPKAPKS
jgi:hypothetical protein